MSSEPTVNKVANLRGAIANSGRNVSDNKIQNPPPAIKSPQVASFCLDISKSEVAVFSESTEDRAQDRRPADSSLGAGVEFIDDCGPV